MVIPSDAMSIKLLGELVCLLGSDANVTPQVDGYIKIDLLKSNMIPIFTLIGIVKH